MKFSFPFSSIKILQHQCRAKKTCSKHGHVSNLMNDRALGWNPPTKDLLSFPFLGWKNLRLMPSMILSRHFATFKHGLWYHLKESNKRVIREQYGGVTSYGMSPKGLKMYQACFFMFRSLSYWSYLPLNCWHRMPSVNILKLIYSIFRHYSFHQIGTYNIVHTWP